MDPDETFWCNNYLTSLHRQLDDHFLQWPDLFQLFMDGEPAENWLPAPMMRFVKLPAKRWNDSRQLFSMRPPGSYPSSAVVALAAATPAAATPAAATPADETPSDPTPPPSARTRSAAKKPRAKRTARTSEPIPKTTPLQQSTSSLQLPPYPQPPSPPVLQSLPTPQPSPVPASSSTAPNTLDAPWNDVVRRRSRTSSQSSVSSNPNRPIIKSIQVSGLPKECSTPKAMDQLLKKIPGLLVSSVRVYSSGVAIISSPCQDLHERLLALSHHVGKPLAILQPQAASNRRPTTAPRTPTFSCVLRGVELDVVAEDVKAALTYSNLTFTNAWRIRSRATDRETPLYRITTTSQSTLDHLLSKGLRMFNQLYRAEPSHAPKPQPLQCRKCLKFDHPVSECPQPRSTCGICGAMHPTGTCRIDAVPKCGNCEGDHVAFSPRCPARPAEAATPATAAPLKTTDAPEETYHTDADPAVLSLIRLLSQALSNLFPNLRDRINQILKPLILQFFGLQYAASYSGSWLHISLV